MSHVGAHLFEQLAALAVSTHWSAPPPPLVVFVNFSIDEDDYPNPGQGERGGERGCFASGASSPGGAGCSGGEGGG